MNNGLRMPGLLITTAAALAAALLAPPMVTGQEAFKESYTGFAINMNSGPNTAVIDFTITRWSTDAERGRLLGIVKSEKESYKANELLAKTLQQLPKVGFIRTTTSLAWELRYARQSPLEDGGRRVVLGTDRPINFYEVQNRTRTMDYPLTIIDIHFDKNDKGVGKILAGTKLYEEKGNLVLENYGTQPIRFNEIKRVK